MTESVFNMPFLLFALTTDDQGVTTLGDEAKVQMIPDNIMVLLRVIEGAEPGKGYQIRETPVTIGRDKICTISIKDSKMSRQHSALFYFAPDFFLKDQASTNGTFVNDKPIKQVKLNSGDKIRMGGTVFEFIVSRLPEGK